MGRVHKERHKKKSVVVIASPRSIGYKGGPSKGGKKGVGERSFLHRMKLDENRWKALRNELSASRKTGKSLEKEGSDSKLLFD